MSLIDDVRMILPRRYRRTKILCHFNHFFGKASGFTGRSTAGILEERSELVKKALAQLRGLPFDMDIRVCGFPGFSLVPIDLDLSAIGEPQHIVYASIECMFNALHDYDFFLNIEDDILVGSEVIQACIGFNAASTVNEIYLPNRMERGADGSLYCLDLLAMPGWNATSHRIFQKRTLGIANNPHSGLFFLSRKQMQYASSRVNFGRRELVVGGFMASAYANLHAPFLLWRARSDLLAHHVVHLDRWTASDPALMVNSYYRTAFGRDPDLAGLAHCIDRLQSAVSPEGLAEELVSSVEFQTRHGTSRMVDEKFLTALYRDGLGRCPDRDGLAHWLIKGENGATRATVLAAFAASSEALRAVICSQNAGTSRPNPVGKEFNQIAGLGYSRDRRYAAKSFMLRNLIPRTKSALVRRLPALGNRFSLKPRLPGDPLLFVHSLYKAALGRLADSTVLASCVQQLRSGVQPEALAERLAASAEFQARHGSNKNVDAEFLHALYRDALGRKPDPEGLTNWLAEGQKGATRAKVVAAFAASDEALRGVAILLVNSLYRAAFGRPTGEAELVNSVQQILSGVSLEDLAEGVVTSAEFQDRHGASQRVGTEFLTDLYRDGVGRKPEPEGLAHWLEEGNKGATRTKVLAAFARSNEALQNSADLPRTGDPALLVNGLYKAAFGRLADRDGLTNRIRQLRLGVPLQTLAEEFVASAEFQARHGLSQKVDTEFLEALYRDGLGREADPEGLVNWLDAGEKGATRAKVLAAFASSDEAIQKVANLYVSSLYRTAFGRNPDEAGLANCIKQLQSGSSLQDLAEGLAVSAEFQGRHGQIRKINVEYLRALYRDALGRQPDSEGLAFWLAEGDNGASRAKVLAAFAGSHEALQKLESMTNRGWKGALLPPSLLTPCGRLTDTPESFHLSACEEADRLTREFSLSETSDILDIGCGVGRLAIGLKARGLAFGSYLGIDVSSERIEWCVSYLAPTDHRLRFRFIDMKNERYNPSGRIGLNLSLPNDCVDVVYIYSVFTHLLEDDIREYLRLISSVLRPGGKCFVTMFVADGVASVTENPTNFGSLKWTGPSHCVLYDRSHWFEMLKAAGLEVVQEEPEINIDGQTGYTLRKSSYFKSVVSSTNGKSPSVLVGFFGLNRSERWTLSSIKSSIFDPLQAFGFEQVRVAHFNAPEVIYSPRSGEHGIPHAYVSANNFGLELSWVEPQCEDNISEYLSIVMNTPLKGEDDDSGTIRRNALQQLHSLRRLGQLLHLLELGRFDLFCFFRPDLLYVDQIPIERIWKLIHADHLDIITPSWHRFGGFNDRFAFCSRRGIDTYLNRIKWVPELCRLHGRFHSESLLCFAIESEGLSFEFVNMRAKRVRATGTVQEENFDV